MLKDIGAKKRIELIIIGLGIIIFIFLITNNMPKLKNDKAASKTESYAALGQIMTAASETESANDIKWGRDPFLPDASNIKEQGAGDLGLALNGIVADKENPYAVINNDVFKLGDRVNGMTIIEINENSVVLEQDGQKHTLVLNAY